MLNLNRTIFALLIGIFTLTAGCSGDSEQPQESNNEGRTLDYTQEITFSSAEGDSITTIQAALADEEQERNEGLMDVNDLPSDRGMLFIFEEQQPLSFWMANTPLSLDIMFVNEDMEIVRIHQNTQPFSEENFTSDVPARYVIETNGGFALNHDIREGMRVEF